MPIQQMMFPYINYHFIGHFKAMVANKPNSCLKSGCDTRASIAQDLPV